MEHKYIESLLTDYDTNIKLDNDQKNVVLDDSDILMVIAGAGSGKTTTIAAKIKYLVDIKKINPSEILVISLTNKAVNELYKIIIEDLKIEAQVCTFHKLAYDILKKEDSRYKIIDNQKNILQNLVKGDKETRKIIKYVLKDKCIKTRAKHIKEYEEVLVQQVLNNINLIKTLNIEINELGTKKDIYFNYLKRICTLYDNTLKSGHLLDFDDIISKSSNCKIQAKYKYIIVDEYQDISQNRLILLKKMLEVTKAKLVLVGDDFQTIFSFAGSETKNFMTFSDKKGFRIVKIRNTYRNSQQIINIAGSFVMKDKALISKNLKSDKSIQYPLRILGYSNNFDVVFERAISKIIEDYGVYKTILVLGRYKKDIDKLHSENFIVKENRIIYTKNPLVKIDYLTIHAAKGLGYDNVILINLEKGTRGFPTSIKNDKYTKQILGYVENLNEERRLLYVAITRTKNLFYGITKIGKESDFVKELIQFEHVTVDYKIKTDYCSMKKREK